MHRLDPGGRRCRHTPPVWQGPAESIVYDVEAAKATLRCLDKPCYVVQNGHGIGLTHEGSVAPLQVNERPEYGGAETHLVAAVAPVDRAALGDPGFLETYGVKAAYMAGSMANGIASEEMVIALGNAGFLGAFGAGGLSPQRLEDAIHRIQGALPDGPFAFNLIHSPHEPLLERRAVELYLKHGVRVIEASAYLALTPYLVAYRAAGLSVGMQGQVQVGNRVIAKLSRREVAQQFMHPAPEKLLQPLVAEGLITPDQAELARRVPVADDITVEADSGGHTDNRPLVCLLPSISALRDEVQAEQGYETPVRIGAGGGIGTPVSALGAFMMGAAYVVTGSVNHGCVEAGTSGHVKKLLSMAGMADVMMAPAADMFELGVNVQVLKRGTMFGLRGRKLYELYTTYDSLEEIPAAELQKLERQILQRSVEEVWADCVAFFSARDPSQIARAQGNPKRKMALVFRWYLGLATRWGVMGEPGRELDYQIWCGPAMGAFNDWVRGSYLEVPENRHVADVARQIMDGAAYLYRVQALKMQGARLPATTDTWQPVSVDR
ncbi:MAG: PfaD family polyunsaturated fatty acid/polyketide biosynthesis protein [Anaerolineae bacterium]|nr:PfaD family polyunsaturated fatty acid/polyketide biosynthesis protein [Anaerolineae bacterium]